MGLPLNHTIELADFYETIHGKERAVSVGFSRDAHGALVVTEAVTKTTELHRRSSAWGLAGMAGDLLRLYPALRACAWCAPGPCPQPSPRMMSRWWGGCRGATTCFVAAAFMETIPAVPLASEWMASMILGETLPVDLSPYAPDRFLAA